MEWEKGPSDIQRKRKRFSWTFTAVDRNYANCFKLYSTCHRSEHFSDCLLHWTSIQALLNTLRKQSVKWSDQDKMCSLLIDEMSLKEGLYYNQNTDCIEGFECLGSIRNPFVANQLSVFMVRGLTRKWKQSIGYFLSSGPVKATSLKTIAIEAIREIRSISLNLVSLICDQGSNNQSMLAQFGVSVNTPYFYVDGKPCIMYDPPHVLKNTRNDVFFALYTQWEDYWLGAIKSLYQ